MATAMLFKYSSAPQKQTFLQVSALKDLILFSNFCSHNYLS